MKTKNSTKAELDKIWEAEDGRKRMRAHVSNKDLQRKEKDRKVVVSEKELLDAIYAQGRGGKIPKKLQGAMTEIVSFAKGVQGALDTKKVDTITIEFEKFRKACQEHNTWFSACTVRVCRPEICPFWKAMLK